MLNKGRLVVLSVILLAALTQTSLIVAKWFALFGVNKWGYLYVLMPTWIPLIFTASSIAGYWSLTNFIDVVRNIWDDPQGDETND